MYQVLLADDEPHVLQSIQSSIPWESLGLEVAAVAVDGIEALYLLDEMTIDIIITDIRMPGFSGLELSKKIAEEFPEIRVIILSGYANFSYAKEAIDYRVIGYALKPIDEKELTSLLRKAVYNLSQATGSRAELLLEAIDEKEHDRIKELLSSFGLEEPYYVAISNNFVSLERYLTPQVTISLGRSKFLYLSSVSYDLERVKPVIFRLREVGGLGVVESPATARSLSETIIAANLSAYQYFIKGQSTLKTELVYTKNTKSLFEALDIAVSSATKLEEFLKELRAEPYSEYLNIVTAYTFYEKVFASPWISSDFFLEELRLYGFEVLTNEYQDFDDMLNDMISQLTFFPQQAQEISSPSSILRVIKYISEHYFEEISLALVADKFQFNSSYLSQLIRKETGLTYSQYVSNLRIEKAKELLLTTTLSLQDISEQVGFNDYFYFNRKFRQAVGVPPGQFVKQYGM